MVIPKLPKLVPWVRFPSPAPERAKKPTQTVGFFHGWLLRAPLQRRIRYVTDFLDYQVATVGVAGFPVPVTGLTSGEANGGLYSVFIAPGVALHVAVDEVNQSGFTARQFLERCNDHAASRVVKSDPVLAGSMTVFDLIAALHFCLATKRETDEDVRRSIQALLNARKDLVELMRKTTH